MKPIARFFIPMLCIIFWACGLKTGVFTISGKLGPGEELFSKAEKLFEARSYEEALATYNEYLLRYPDGALAGGALMKIGAIYTVGAKYPQARKTYSRLIAEYPHSPFVPDAKVEILADFYHEGRYKEVVEQAADFLAKTDSRVHIIRAQVIVGDAYLAMGSAADAVTSYAAAYQKAAGTEKKSIVERFKEAAGQLNSTDIDYLLTRIKNDYLAGYLMYQLGANYAREGKDYADAAKVLSAFVEKFPHHEKAQDAAKLIKEISKMSLYSRYTIGCLLPLSGRYKTYGERTLRGVELALNQFSASGTNPAVKVIIKDTGSDLNKAASAVQELLKENVAAIIGPLVTAETAALEAQNSGIPIITLTQKEDITQIGDYVFRNFFTPKMQVKAVVSFAVEKLGLDSFAILYPDENYGTTFMNLFWDEVLAHGATVVGAESYNASDTDFANPIKKLVGLYYEVPEDLKAALSPPDDDTEDVEGQGLFDTNLNDTLGNRYDLSPKDTVPAAGPSEEIDQNKQGDPQEMPAENGDQEEKEEEEPQPIVDFDAVFIPDAPQKAGLIIPQLAFYDVRETYLLGTNLWHSDSLIEMARQYAQGAIMTDGFFDQSTVPQVKNFVSLFQETYGLRPEFIEAVAYDTAMILFELVSRPEVQFRSVLKEELAKLKDYPGITGLTSFDENGDVHKKLHLLQIKGNGFVELEQP